MISKVECHLLFSWGICLVIAVVSFNGDDTLVTYCATEC